MARSVWAAAGATVLVLALTPGAALAAGGGSPTARPASTHANHPMRPAPAQRQVAAVTLFPGAGYRRAGGSGRVRALQRRLARMAFAPGRIDGRYGPLTTSSVERFQAAVGLTVDGIAGPRTVAALNATPSSALFPGAGYQQTGGSGRVRALQQRLARMGFAPGPIDGRYGPLTTAAVERFQARHRLRIDGIVGKQTLHALRVAEHRASVGRPPRARPTPQVKPTPRVKRGPRSTPALRHESPPTLPVSLILLAFAALGVATILAAYIRTRAVVLRHSSEDELVDEGQRLPPSQTEAHINRRLVMPHFSVSRGQLEQAARLRAEGATWNQIRAKTGAQLGSNQFMRAWEREGIRPSHRARHQRAGASEINTNGGDQ